MCDTLDEGQETGEFCGQRAKWLHQTPTDRSNTPTLIGLHHLLILSGFKWIISDPGPSLEWIDRLDKTIRPHSQVCAITSGHMNRAQVRRFSSRLVSVAPATSIQLTLDLTKIDMTVQAGRKILIE